MGTFTRGAPMPFPAPAATDTGGSDGVRAQEHGSDAPRRVRDVPGLRGAGAASSVGGAGPGRVALAASPGELVCDVVGSSGGRRAGREAGPRATAPHRGVHCCVTLSPYHLGAQEIPIWRDHRMIGLGSRTFDEHALAKLSGGRVPGWPGAGARIDRDGTLLDELRGSYASGVVAAGAPPGDVPGRRSSAMVKPEDTMAEWGRHVDAVVRFRKPVDDDGFPARLSKPTGPHDDAGASCGLALQADGWWVAVGGGVAQAEPDAGEFHASMAGTSGSHEKLFLMSSGRRGLLLRRGGGASPV